MKTNHRDNTRSDGDQKRRKRGGHRRYCPDGCCHEEHHTHDRLASDRKRIAESAEGRE